MIYPSTGVTQGGDILRIDGVNFGLPDPSAYTQIIFDGQRLDPVRSAIGAPNAAMGGQRNHSVWFQVPQFPGQGLNKQVFIVTGQAPLGGAEQKSDPVIFNYLPPELDKVSTFEGTRNGQVRLVIDGLNFGVSGKVHGVKPPTSLTNPDGSVDCTRLVTSMCEVAQGENRPLPTIDLESSCGPQKTDVCWEHQQITVLFGFTCGCIRVEVSSGDDAQLTPWETFIDFDPLVDADGTQALFNADPNYRADLSTVPPTPHGFRTKGGARITVKGRYFGTEAVKVTIGGKPCTNDAAGNDATIKPVSVGPTNERRQTLQCYVPEGQGPNTTNILQVEKGSQRSCAKLSSNGLCKPLFVAYKRPRIANLTRNNVPTSGEVIRISGNNLGTFGLIKVNDVVVSSGAVTWIKKHEEIEVRFPPGEGKAHSLTVDVSSQVDELCTDRCTIDYDPPFYVDVVPDHGATAAKNVITLTGNNFGLSRGGNYPHRGAYNYSGPSVTLGGRDCAVTTFTHTSLSCVVPEGFGVNKLVVVTVQGQASTSDLTYYYDSPEVTSILPGAAPTSGLVRRFGDPLIVTVQGKNFGSWEALSQFAVMIHSGKVAVGRLDLLEFDPGTTVINQTTTHIFELTHTSVTFQMAPGQGKDLRVAARVVDRVSAPTPVVAFSYNPPRLETVVAPLANKDGEHTGPTSGCLEFESRADWNQRLEGYDEATIQTKPTLLQRLCKRPATITVNGSSLGMHSLSATVGQYVAETDCSDLTLAENRKICRHGHYEITMLAPVGFGRDHRIVVDVGGRSSNDDLLYHFDPPSLEQAFPGSVSRGNGYLDALGIEDGSELEFSGSDFGGVESNTSVLIDGEECPFAKWHPADNDGFPYVSCKPLEMTVGAKNITLTVALQTIERFGLTGERLSKRSLVSTICKSRTNTTSGLRTVYYGRTGEYCAPCPEGGICQPETMEDPYAKPKFWLSWLNTTEVDGDLRRANGKAEGLGGIPRCDPKRWDRDTFGKAIVQDRCADIIPCTPADSCTGNNTCAEGYQWQIESCLEKRLAKPEICSSDLDCDPDPKKECGLKNPEHCSVCVFGDENALRSAGVTNTSLSGNKLGICQCRGATRCALCTSGTHYRLDGKCEPCPSDPVVLIILLVCAVVCACIGGYVLGQKRFNMAFLSIGVDYIQVLALFAGSDIKWPGWMKRMFQILSFFNFNVDVTAPECLVPDLPFEIKWYAMMGLPLMAGGALSFVWCSKLCFKFCCKGKKKWRELNTHASRILATFTLLYYYMYLSLTKTALRVFNCNPIVPADGFLYTDFTDLTCEGGLCRCDIPGGLQSSLKAPAALGLVVYTLGYPAFILIILKLYKGRIKEDQLLRAADIGNDRRTTTSNETYSVRKRWHKLYYHFKRASPPPFPLLLRNFFLFSFSFSFLFFSSRLPWKLNLPPSPPSTTPQLTNLSTH
jgi:hypothetical protein